MRKIWWLPVAVLVVLSLDVWNWGQSRMLLFLPGWMWHVVAVTALFSLAFFIIARYEWRDR